MSSTGLQLTPRACFYTCCTLLQVSCSFAPALSSSTSLIVRRAALPPEALDDHASGLHEYLIVEFVLTLLYGGLKKGGLTGSKAPEALGRLDPLPPLLARALHCRHSPSVCLALKCLALLVPLPLPSLREAAPAAGKAVAGLLKRVPNIAQPVAQDSFRLLAGEPRMGGGSKPRMALHGPCCRRVSQAGCAARKR